MAKVYLPPMTGLHNPGQGVQFGPGEVVEIIPYAGYGFRFVEGGIFLYKRWWRKLLDLVL